MLQAADESNIPFLASALTFDALLAAVPFVLLLLVGLTTLAHALANGTDVDPTALFHRFLPAHPTAPGQDPFKRVEDVLTRISRNRGQLSLYAAPAFIWFSTRLFSGIRVSLNDIYDVAVRPQRPRGFLATIALAKLRDAGMVVATVFLFLLNTALSTALAVIQARGAEAVPQLEFLLTNAGRFAGEALTFLFSVALFYLVYKYASVRRLPWSTALLGATFTAILFEVAKRLYGLYLANVASLGARPGAGDANLGAVILFVLWVYYTAIVFLLGAVVAETWELRRMQRRQRAILG